jgi:prepilin signal peptidase PulO-like enzyme (type II secretory pathway)
VNLILQIPIEFRLAALFVTGVCLGGLLNLGVYTLSWETRLISPWWRPSHHELPSFWRDRVPVFGWLGLRRETDLHGKGFWIRPMIVEFLCGVGLAALYWWEVYRLGLYPGGAAAGLPAGWTAVVHAQYLCHVILIALMIVASLIDADEKIIPDSITVPGTLVGLFAAAVYPWSLLPERVALVEGRPEWFLQLASPSEWPGWLGEYPQPWSLALGLVCWLSWCFALMPRTWYIRHGRIRAFQLMVARLLRESHTWLIGLMGLLGAACIAAVWFHGSPYWRGLLSALVGMAAGGGIVWAVRVIGTRALGREAMGFGDVTLMAMIGAFFGWQASLWVFFLAPFAGLLIGILNLVFRRDQEIPYGPFLCLAALAVIVGWDRLWRMALPYFQLAWIVPMVILACLALMALLLALIRLIKLAFGARAPARK